jgi:hypothetical protein
LCICYAVEQDQQRRTVRWEIHGCLYPDAPDGTGLHSESPEPLEDHADLGKAGGRWHPDWGKKCIGERTRNIVKACALVEEIANTVNLPMNPHQFPEWKVSKN